MIFLIVKALYVTTNPKPKTLAPRIRTMVSWCVEARGACLRHTLMVLCEGQELRRLAGEGRGLEIQGSG